MTHVESSVNTSTLPRWSSGVEAAERSVGKIPYLEMLSKIRAILKGRYEDQATLLLPEALALCAAELAAQNHVASYRVGDTEKLRKYLAYPAAYETLLRNMLVVIEKKTRFPWKYAESRKRIQDVLGIPRVEPHEQVRRPETTEPKKTQPLVERNVDQIAAMISSAITYGGSASLVKKVLVELGITDETPGVIVVDGRVRRYSIEIQIRVLEAMKSRPKLRSANPTLDKRMDTLITSRLLPHLNPISDEAT